MAVGALGEMAAAEAQTTSQFKDAANTSVHWAAGYGSLVFNLASKEADKESGKQWEHLSDIKIRFPKKYKGRI